MSQIHREGQGVDVMIFAEGTYPFVRGGVSSWIHQLIENLDSIRFGICFLGSRESDYAGIQYTLPKNLVHFEAHYLFDSLNVSASNTSNRFKEEELRNQLIVEIHQALAQGGSVLEEIIQNPAFFTEELSRDFFMRSRSAWSYLVAQYEEHCPELPFIDYFWTVRNIHSPLWLLASIAAGLPNVKVLHSPSTGYAGFVAALHSYYTGTPFFLTEHGIYTRERKIELLNADWISYRKPTLLRKPEEINYIRELWIAFFFRLGQFGYHRAEKIFSLFPEAQKIQWSYGAAPEKTEVIPNGVNTKRLATALGERPRATIPKVISLIGRVVPIKDIKTFIRALRIVTDALSEVEGWIVGPTEEDPVYYRECQQMVESMGLENNIKFLGFQNILEIFPKTGLLTLTSISEGMPLVILEGFAAGVPCVATDVGSCRVLIEGGLDEEDEAMGSAGAVTHIADPSQLAREYLRFLQNETLWRQAQQSGLERVDRYYREELFLAKYRNYYEEAIADGGHRL